MAYKYLDKKRIIEMYTKGWSPDLISIVLTSGKKEIDEEVRKCIRNLQKKN